MLRFSTPPLPRLRPVRRPRTAPGRARSRARTRPARSSAHGRRFRAIRSSIRRRAARSRASRPVSPRRAAATSVAQAAEPQPSVTPTPRSQTLSAIASRAKTSANEILAFSGNRGCVSKRGPTISSGTRSDVLDPEDRVRIAHVDDARRAEVGRAGEARDRPCACRRLRCASGISSQARRGAPMSTRQVQAPRRSQAISPAAFRSSAPARPTGRASRSATQRVPLPQAPASLPSLL